MLDESNPYAPPLTPPVEQHGPERARVNPWAESDLTAASILLACCGVVGVLTAAFQLHIGFFLRSGTGFDRLWGCVVLFQATLVIVGAIAMYRPQHRYLAIAGCWAAALPVLGFACFTFLVGIWCLSLVSRRAVKAAFRS